ncbi:MAG: hypothetical protein HQ557_01900 [Bacteroidetes bacterium]|nr:hypothetical protein [Bacteroidota bacterium]
MLPKQDIYIQSITSYIDKSLGLSIIPQLWNESDKLPLLLTEQYMFYTFKLAGLDCLLFIAKTNESTPAVIVKHGRLLTKYWKGGIIFSKSGLTSTDRTRLITAKVPFIIPDKQLYLPFVGIDMKELFPLQPRKGQTVSPSAQVLILGKLYNKSWISDSPSKISDQIGMTKMSIGRAFKELELHGVVDIKKKGREKTLVFEQKGKMLWKNVLNIIKSPVTSSETLPFKPKINMVLSGESALSKYTMIQEPYRKTFAVSNRSSYLATTDGITPIDTGTDFVIEKWSYNPDIFSQNGVADPLSVFLKFKTTDDERIEKALDELIADMKW